MVLVQMAHFVRKRCFFLLISVFAICLYFYTVSFITQDNCADLLSAKNGNLSFTRPWQNHSKNLVTVVTAFYQVPSKRSHCQYLRWIDNFLRNIPCHLYIFTSKQEHPILASMRMEHRERTRITIQELDELEEYSKMPHWKQITSTDPEKYHSPELYVVWNQKWQFVQDAMEENIFQSDYFVWCDIGSFRSPEFLPDLIRFPDADLLRKKVPDPDKILITLVGSFSSEEFLYPNGSLSSKLRTGEIDHVAAGFAAGHTNAWKLFIARYYEMQRYFFNENLNAGKEQNILNALVLKYPASFQLLEPEDYFNGNGDHWFYFQYYLSQ